MENDITNKSDDSFASLTLPLANFVRCATKLPESAYVLHDKYQDFEFYLDEIDIGIMQHLTTHNIDTLCRWIDLLKKISSEIIDKSCQYYHSPLCTISTCEDKRDDIKYKINNVIVFITDILQTHTKLTPKPKSESIIQYTGEFLYLANMREALVKYGMIDNTPYFSEILQGKKKDKKINWKMTIYALHYYIAELFATDLFSGYQWEFTKNSFTIKGKSVPKNIGRVKKDDIKKDNLTITNIDKVIKDLNKQTFSPNSKNNHSNNLR